MTRQPRPARVRRRLVVRFSTGSGAAPKSGCTMDLSSGGMFLNVGWPLAPGTHVLGALELPNGRRAEVHGVVAWARQVPRALDSVLRGGMGLRLLWADSNYFEYLADASSR